jgi:hypothetical protein
LETHKQALSKVELQEAMKDINLCALVNESRKEHGFAKHKQTGQYRHPTKQQYTHSKRRHEVELIKKTCNCPHSYNTNTFSAYQPTNASHLSSLQVIQQYKKWNMLFGPPTDTTRITIDAQQHLKTARMLNVLTKSRPCQNIRDLYRYKCGYGPCVIFQKDALFQNENEEIERRYPDFQEQMNALQIRRGETTMSVDRRTEGNKYAFVPGDIVAVNEGFKVAINGGCYKLISHMNPAKMEVAAMYLGSGSMKKEVKKIIADIFTFYPHLSKYILAVLSRILEHL